MENITNELQADWSPILDELREIECLSSDAKLAASLGVTRGYLCSVRKGRKGVSLELAKEIFSKLGKTFDVERLEMLFLPAKVRTHVAAIKSLRNFVISRANAQCEICGLPAPFNTPDGLPYLELNHIVPTRDGGGDTPQNLIAICSNCHRKEQVATTNRLEHKKLMLLAKKWTQSKSEINRVELIEKLIKQSDGEIPRIAVNRTTDKQ